MPKAKTKKNKGKISNVRVTVGHTTIRKIENWNDVKVIGSSLLTEEDKRRKSLGLKVILDN